MKIILSVTLASLLAIGLIGCDSNQGPAESAGEQVDEMMQETQEQLEQATEETSEELEEAADKLREETSE
jgi:hypothetical protein